MKINRNQLRRIIKEALSKQLSEEYRSRVATTEDAEAAKGVFKKLKNEMEAFNRGATNRVVMTTNPVLRKCKSAIEDGFSTKNAQVLIAHRSDINRHLGPDAFSDLDYDIMLNFVKKMGGARRRRS